MVGLLFAFMPVLAGNTGADSASRLEVVQLLVRRAHALLLLRAPAACPQVPLSMPCARALLGSCGSWPARWRCSAGAEAQRRPAPDLRHCAG